jgi:hypothetical protein
MQVITLYEILKGSKPQTNTSTGQLNDWVQGHLGGGGSVTVWVGF